MSRALIVLNGNADREKAIAWVRSSPPGTRLEFKITKRTIPQNKIMWVLLTEIAEQLTWHGLHIRAEDYKYLLLDSLKREMRIVPNIDGTGFVNLGRSSSDLTKQEMSDLIELIYMFGAKHGVKFTINQ